MRHFVGALLVLQVAAMAWAPTWAPSVLNAGAAMLAAAAAAWCGRTYGWSQSHGWSLLIWTWLLWSAGALLSVLQRLSGDEATFPALAGVAYLLSMLPLLQAISVAGLERRDPLLRGIDMVSLLALGALYCAIRLHWFGPDFINVDPVWLADLQNLILALLAGVRRAAAVNDGERRFFGVLFPTLLLRLATTAAYNRAVELDPAQVDVWVRALPSLPYLVFALLATSPKLPAAWPGAARWAPFARAASPLALAVLLLATASLVVARGELALGLTGIVLGVFGYGFRSTLLLVRIEETARQMHHLARTDALTDIPNRRGFDEAATLVWQDAARRRQRLAVMMIDIDHFKALNDRFGHTQGDDCLRTVARLLVEAMDGERGIVARVGGEEFAVMLPGMGPHAAAQLAERMRARIQSSDSPVVDTEFPLTISIGLVTALPNDETTLKSALILADRMLYQAKQRGRNRVCAAPDQAPAGA